MSGQGIPAERHPWGRDEVGRLVVIGSLIIVGVIACAVAGGGLAVVASSLINNGSVTAEQMSAAFSGLRTFTDSIVPLFAAWVGAVIAFYFARDNLNAATQNTRLLLDHVAGPAALEAFTAAETMVPRKSMIVAVQRS